MLLRDAIYALYARRLRARLAGRPMPRHVALVMDGNRRWAAQMGMANPSVGHRHGGEHVEQVLSWCASLGIRHVSIFVASADNLRKRPAAEVDYLMQVIEDVVAERLARPSSRWRVHIAGRLDALPDSTAHALKLAADSSAEGDRDGELTIAIGYDGREEITDALRSLLDQRARAGITLAELAETVTASDIAAHLYTAGAPDPDLLIRTSGERRLSGFLIWQAAHCELQFCDVYWPAFRHVDFLRALRCYAASQNRDPRP